ncbi:hypothetical protein ACH4LA_11860 [Streptomyces albogriseolus]|uniref:hypothetical protein n=1 Tax=Streptomyces albogriseolus TaxID=1887 RepID=UPI0037A669D3
MRHGPHRPEGVRRGAAATGTPPARSTPTALHWAEPAYITSDITTGTHTGRPYRGDVPHRYEALEPGTKIVLIMQHV